MRRVLVSQVRLYMDCEEYHRVAFTRSPQPLTFEASSGIFVGNAGGTGLPRFVVSLDGTAATACCFVFVVLLNHIVYVCITISCKRSGTVRIFLKYAAQHPTPTCPSLLVSEGLGQLFDTICRIHI